MVDVVYATAQDVRDASHRTLSQSDAWLENRMAAAHARLRARVPGLDARVSSTTDPLAAALVRDVLVEVVLRVARNPDGYRQESDQDYSYTRDRDVAPGRIVITDEDLELLGANRPFTGTVTGVDHALPHVWRHDPFPEPRSGGWC